MKTKRDVKEETALFQNGYTEFKKIGEGVSGHVYKAKRNGKQVAIKIMRIPRPPLSPLMELYIQTKIQVPFIVPLNRVFTFEHSFLGMEMPLALGSLDNLEDRPTPLQLLELGFELFCGLSQLHSKGIVHLDIKPANILVFERKNPEEKEQGMLSWIFSFFSSTEKTGKEVRLADFGLARFEINPNVLLPANVVSPFWRAPEQLSAIINQTGTWFGPGLDVWSMGLVLLELFLFSVTGIHKPIFEWTRASDTDDAKIMLNESARFFQDVENPDALMEKFDLGSTDSVALETLKKAIFWPLQWDVTKRASAKQIADLLGKELGQVCTHQDKIDISVPLVSCPEPKKATSLILPFSQYPEYKQLQPLIKKTYDDLCRKIEATSLSTKEKEKQKEDALALVLWIFYGKIAFNLLKGETDIRNKGWMAKQIQSFFSELPRSQEDTKRRKRKFSLSLF